MSSGLPFPLSDHRSVRYHSRFQDESVVYDGRAHMNYQSSPATSELYSSPRGHTSGNSSSLSGIFQQPAYGHETSLQSDFYGDGTNSERPLSASVDVPQSFGHISHYASSRSNNSLQSYSDPIYHATVSQGVFSPENVSVHSSSQSTSPREPSETLSPLAATPRSPPRYASKPRREKTRIELAPDQPLTTQGKPRTRVYVACIQCRGRKIRCDGAKPTCHNCSRRIDAGSPCSYDLAPKRRGPDKTPGARQRLMSEDYTDGGRPRKRARKRTTAVKEDQNMAGSAQSGINSNGSVRDQPTAAVLAPVFPVQIQHTPHPGGSTLRDSYIVDSRQRNYDYMSSLNPSVYHSSSTFPQLLLNNHVEHGSRYLQHTATIHDPSLQSYNTPVMESPCVGLVPTASVAENDTNDDETQYREGPHIIAEPSLQFTRETWWDALLSLYATPSCSTQVAAHLAPGMREMASRNITNDLRFLFRTSNYWFSFIHVPRFFTRLLDSRRRATVQPSLVLAALAIAVFFQSSELGEGLRGRERALRLRDEAQGALEASVNARWVDEGLVQASWLLAFFEVCAHPKHSTQRIRSALIILDSLIRGMRLTVLDKHDTRVSTFVERAVPCVPAVSTLLSEEPWDAQPEINECACASFTLGKNWMHAQTLTPLWVATPTWAMEFEEADIRKEECRRLVWSSVMLVAGNTSYAAVSSTYAVPDLFVMDPANYALLFPGESLGTGARKKPAKDSVWALYIRAMLLWHSCICMRGDPHRSDAEKAQFAVRAWLETDVIEAALVKHTCTIERAFLFQGREYLFNSRICISYEFQRYIPQAMSYASLAFQVFQSKVSYRTNLIFHRKKAEEWLSHQDGVANRVMLGLHTVTGQPTNSLTHRPFFIFWFMSQIYRALSLWECDKTLTIALDVAKDLFAPIDYLMSIWPCSAQRRQCHVLRDRLANACYVSGLQPPPDSPVLPSVHITTNI